MKRYYRELAASGEMLTGVILQLPSEELAEILAHAGVDVIILDTEHSPTGYEKLVSLIRACETFGALAFVRVPSARDEAAIKRALDAGAGGIMIPNVDTAEDARRAVEYAKFPPLGRRGACPFVRANAYGGEDRTDFYAKANAETAIILLVESPEGIRNLPEIVKVEGADMLQIGTVDLAVAMGLPGQTEHPEIFSNLKSETEGKKMVKETIEHFRRIGKGYLVPDYVIMCGFRLIGYKLGRNYKKLPKGLARAFASNTEYFTKWK